MKRTLLIAGLAALCAAVPARAATLEELGVDETEVTNWIHESVVNGAPIYGASAAMRETPAVGRAAVVELFGAIAGRYLKSQDFATRYAQRREESKPIQPESMLSNDELRAQYRKQLQEGFAEMEKNAATLPQEYRDQMKVTLDEMKKQLAEIDDPNNPAFTKEAEEARRVGAEEEIQHFEADLAQWEKEWPADALAFVAARLRWALEETKDIDHAAILTAPGEDGRKLFTDPAHEARSPTWKLGYRVGKEAVDAARAIATTLLKDLPAN